MHPHLTVLDFYFLLILEINVYYVVLHVDIAETFRHVITAAIKTIPSEAL